jgi:hypothetical protein
MLLNSFRKAFLPYVLLKQPCGRYAVLNREYKPVGFNTGNFIHYDEHPVLVRIIGLTPLRASKISVDGSADLDRIRLYDEAYAPTSTPANRSAYFKRLGLLMSLETESDELYTQREWNVQREKALLNGARRAF